MPSTELFVRPIRHRWETPVAYLFRVAFLNRTSYKSLARQALSEFALAGQSLIELWQRPGYDCPARDAVRFSLLGLNERPLRLVCPRCVEEGFPDSLYDKYPYTEYCLRHGCKPVRHCPGCATALQYGIGSYGFCRCGFDLASTSAELAPPGVLRLYLAVAADMPLEMTPTRHELEGQELQGVHQRLRSTWRLLWNEELQDPREEDGRDALALLPPAGTRWLAASTMLGIAEHRLTRWVTHLGCWWRNGRYQSEIALPARGERPTSRIRWRYLRALMEQSLSSGCSGPPAGTSEPAHACTGAGAQCKSRRSGKRGDGLPLPFRLTIGPCMKGFERPARVAVRSSGCRPPGKSTGATQSMSEFSRVAGCGARKVVELVAIGALQPVELSHPWAWRFAKGDVEDLLRHAFRSRLSSYRVDSGGTLASWRMSTDWLQAPAASMGGMFKALCFGRLRAVTALSPNVWMTPFVNGQDEDFDEWAQRAVHDAVLPSLEGRAREAAVLAQCFLGNSTLLNKQELDLFCGPPPSELHFLDTLSQPSDSPVPFQYEMPRSIAWRNGILHDSSLLKSADAPESSTVINRARACPGVTSHPMQGVLLGNAQ